MTDTNTHCEDEGCPNSSTKHVCLNLPTAFGLVQTAWADKAAFTQAMSIGKGCDVWPKAGDYTQRTGRELIPVYTLNLDAGLPILSSPYSVHYKMTEKDFGFAEGWNALRSRLLAGGAPVPSDEQRAAQQHQLRKMSAMQVLLTRAQGHPVILEIMADCADCVETEDEAQWDREEDGPYDGSRWRILAAELRERAAAIRAEDPEIWQVLTNP